jgi:hypothetical protein
MDPRCLPNIRRLTGFQDALILQTQCRLVQGQTDIVQANTTQLILW